MSPPGLEHGPGELVVVARFVASGLEQAARDAVILCSREVAARLPARSLWVHSHVMWVVALLLAEVAPAAALRGPSEPRVAPEAELAGNVHVAHGAVIYPNVSIGADSCVGENVVIYGNVRIGARSSIGAGSVLGRPGFGWVQGPSGAVVRMPHPAGLRIGDDVEIGPLCTLDAGVLAPTRVGDRCKLDAHVHVGHNVVIGSDCRVAAQAGFAGSVSLGPDVLVGGQAGVADHRQIGAGARIAAQAGVISDVPAGATYAGYPALPRGEWLRAWAALKRLATRRGT